MTDTCDCTDVGCGDVTVTVHSGRPEGCTWCRCGKYDLMGGHFIEVRDNSFKVDELHGKGNCRIGDEWFIDGLTAPIPSSVE